MQPHPDREVLKLLTECSPFNLEAKKFFDPNALRLAVAPSNREDCKDCDSAEKPPHFDLCSALRNAADTNIKLSIDKLLWPTLPKPAK